MEEVGDVEEVSCHTDSIDNKDKRLAVIGKNNNEILIHDGRTLLSTKSCGRS